MAHITCLLSGRSALHALPDGTPNTGLSKRETAEAVKEQVGVLVGVRQKCMLALPCPNVWGRR